MPRNDLVLPSQDRSAEPVDLGWAGFVMQVGAELSDELGCGVGVVDGVDGSHQFFCVLGHANLVTWITSAQQALESVITIRR